MAKLRIEYFGNFREMVCSDCGRKYTVGKSSCEQGCGAVFEELVLIMDGQEIKTERRAA